MIRRVDIFLQKHDIGIDIIKDEKVSFVKDTLENGNIWNIVKTRYYNVNKCLDYYLVFSVEFISEIHFTGDV